MGLEDVLVGPVSRAPWLPIARRTGGLLQLWHLSALPKVTTVSKKWQWNTRDHQSSYRLF